MKNKENDSKLITYIKKIYNIVVRPELAILPGNIAFFIMLSIIPIVTVFGLLASSFNISIASLISFISRTIPQDVANIVIPFISGKSLDINLLIFIIIGFFMASNGANSIISASNVMYNQDNGNYITRRIKAVFMTVLLLLLVLFSVLVLAFGDNIMRIITSLEFLRRAGPFILTVFNFIKWPLAFFFMYLIMTIVYTMAPKKQISSRYMYKGSLFSSIAFLIITAAYSFYVSNLANYDIFYGGLSNIIVLMLWLYFMSYALVIGIAINVYDYEKRTEIIN